MKTPCGGSECTVTVSGPVIKKQYTTLTFQITHVKNIRGVFLGFSEMYAMCPSGAAQAGTKPEQITVKGY